MDPEAGFSTPNMAEATATYWLVLIFIWQYLGFGVIILQASLRTTELNREVIAVD